MDDGLPAFFHAALLFSDSGLMPQPVNYTTNQEKC